MAAWEAHRQRLQETHDRRRHALGTSLVGSALTERGIPTLRGPRLAQRQERRRTPGALQERPCARRAGGGLELRPRGQHEWPGVQQELQAGGQKELQAGGQQELQAGGQQELQAGGQQELQAGGQQELQAGGQQELQVGGQQEPAGGRQAHEAMEQELHGLEVEMEEPQEEARGELPVGVQEGSQIGNQPQSQEGRRQGCHEANQPLTGSVQQGLPMGESQELQVQDQQGVTSPGGTGQAERPRARRRRGRRQGGQRAGGQPGVTGASEGVIQPGGQPGVTGAPLGALQPGGQLGAIGAPQREQQPGGQPGVTGAPLGVQQPGGQPGVTGAPLGVLQPGGQPGVTGAHQGALQPREQLGAIGAPQREQQPGGQPGVTGAPLGVQQPGGQPGVTGAPLGVLQPGGQPGATGAPQGALQLGEQLGVTGAPLGMLQPGGQPGVTGAPRGVLQPGRQPGVTGAHQGALQPGEQLGAIGAPQREQQPGGQPGVTGAPLGVLQPGGRPGVTGAPRGVLRPGGQPGVTGAPLGVLQPGGQPGVTGAPLGVLQPGGQPGVIGAPLGVLQPWGQPGVTGAHQGALQPREQLGAIGAPQREQQPGGQPGVTGAPLGVQQPGGQPGVTGAPLGVLQPGGQPGVTGAPQGALQLGEQLGVTGAPLGMLQPGGQPGVIGAPQRTQQPGGQPGVTGAPQRTHQPGGRPGVTGAPEGEQQPGGQPGVTKAPHGVLQPGGQPGVTGAPQGALQLGEQLGVTGAPLGMLQPGGQPGVIGAPQRPQQPGGQPGVTGAPQRTHQPGGRPGVTGAPEGEQQPGGQPGVTKAPHGVLQPGGQPGVTGAPQGVLQPGGQPGVTGAPLGVLQPGEQLGVTGAPLGVLQAGGQPGVTGAPQGVLQPGGQPGVTGAPLGVLQPGGQSGVTGAPQGALQPGEQLGAIGAPQREQQPGGQPGVTGAPLGVLQTGGQPGVTGAPQGVLQPGGQPGATGAPLGVLQPGGQPGVTGAPQIEQQPRGQSLDDREQQLEEWCRLLEFDTPMATAEESEADEEPPMQPSPCPRFLCDTCFHTFATRGAAANHMRVCRAAEAERRAQALGSTPSLVETDTQERPTPREFGDEAWAGVTSWEWEAFFSVEAVGGRTVRRIPQRARSGVLDALCCVLKRLKSRPGDEAATLLLLAFPRLILAVPPKPGIGQKAVIIERLGAFWEGRWRELFDSAMVAARPAVRPLAYTCSDQDPDAIPLSRCRSRCKVGEWSRGLACLTAGELARPSEAMVQSLREKHPASTSEVPQWVRDFSVDAPQRPPLTADILARTIHTAARASAAGPSGWVTEHLRDTFLTEPSCLSHLLEVFNQWVAGQVPERARPWLAASNLVGLSKPNGDVRPVAIGEVLPRILARALCISLRPTMASYFLPCNQMGAGTRAGQQVMESVTREFRDLLFLSYADDTYILGPAARILEAFGALRERLEWVGLEVQAHKCRFWEREGGDVELALPLGMQRVEEGLTVVGVPIGEEGWEVTRFSTADVPGPDYAAASGGGGGPRPMYLARTMPPRMQLHLLVRLGGFGIRAAASLSPLSYVCGWAQAVRDIAQLGVAGEEAMFAEYLTTSAGAEFLDPWFAKALEQLPATIRQEMPGLPLCVAAPPLRLFQARQRLLAVEELQTLRRSARDDATLARFTSLQGSGAGAWVSAVPAHSDFTFTAAEWGIAAATRLGLPIQQLQVAGRCVCGTAYVDPADPHHALRWKHQHGPSRVHDEVKFAVAKISKASRGVVTMEDSVVLQGKRVDVAVRRPMAGEAHALEISVADPLSLSPSLLGQCGRQIGVAAREWERRKTSDYAPLLARNRGVQFTPLIVETWGCLGGRFRRWLRQQGDAHVGLAVSRGACREDDTVFSAYLLGSLKALIGVALQRAQARVILLRAASSMGGINVDLVDREWDDGDAEGGALWVEAPYMVDSLL
ncbi:unnamed protein product [Closterium sp. NIES-65]|nr:unnamed protein product [Closterium sp. NIES-65]